MADSPPSEDLFLTKEDETSEVPLPNSGPASEHENTALVENISRESGKQTERAVADALSEVNETTEADGSEESKGSEGEKDLKRSPAEIGEAECEVGAKKTKIDDSDQTQPAEEKDNEDGPAPVVASKEGINFFHDADVLSGRGGGTNVHPGNRNFRDMINLHRRAYLKARKNDKPAISRAIVRSIRESKGKFLKKDEKTGLWFEIGDDAAREKTSQALRQRAPEMRKLLFDTEREEARAVAEEHLRQQRMYMGIPPNQEMMQNMGIPPGMAPNPMFANPALFAQMQKNGMPMPQGPEAYSHMFSAALMQNGMNRFTSNGT
ncbi:predicted protein [Phaeodactylum tricornutum CCAP 1055/1]|jgi:hypothetical protein|uniref:DUF6824 domain-containing protein n=1 Tax=Phaeodactylum tricornutum (strain CCAP 1055/1) TaxID=556484 RepID=B5Y582_PHATC|nr:predicted protein [Phaeodactylum tricornutum CCAP 1055/1]ACI65611.1 predicted protein [Phaeodactylum tricornutum CCAP 1055/1]|eukprot:XP_002186141.1 predicted protein [Phaeodactylum tricornutum CCAP 1055/1]